jgi:hypothetical protein
MVRVNGTARGTNQPAHPTANGGTTTRRRSRNGDDDDDEELERP